MPHGGNPMKNLFTKTTILLFVVLLGGCRANGVASAPEPVPNNIQSAPFFEIERQREDGRIEYQRQLNEEELSRVRAAAALNEALARKADTRADSAIKRYDTETDVIQSGADATRNVSSGLGKGLSKGINVLPSPTVCNTVQTWNGLQTICR